MRRPVRAEASRNAFEQFGRAPLHRRRAVLHVEGLARAGRRDGVDQRDLLRGRQRRADEAPLDFPARFRRQRCQDRLGRTVDQRIAVPQRRREADPHADIARRARNVFRLGDVVGQPLRAGVMHHHAAGPAERGTRERYGGREIGIDRGQQRQPVQPDLQRLAGGAERARARRPRVIVRVGERRQREQRLGVRCRLDRDDALAVDADRMIADGRIRRPSGRGRSRSFASLHLMLRRRRSRVSKHGDKRGVCRHPSRRRLRRAPQDEV